MNDSTTKLFQCRYKDQCIHPEKQGDGWLPETFEYFFRSNRNKSGHNHACKKCQRKLVKAWAKENTRKMRGYSRKWREENLQYDRQRNRTYRLTHLEAEREKERLYYKNNPDKVREKSRRRRKNNPDQSREYCDLRRSRRLNAIGTHTRTDVRQQYKLQQGRCYYCDVRLRGKYHADHVLPLSRFKDDSKENIVCACASCNHSKGNKTLREWLDIISDVVLYTKVAQRIIEREGYAAASPPSGRST